MVMVHAISVPQGTRAAETYFMPPNIPFTRSDEYSIHMQKIASYVKPLDIAYEFPLTNTSSVDSIRQTSKILAAAIAGTKNELNKNLIDSHIYSELRKIDFDTFSIHATPGSKSKLVSIKCFWEEGSVVNVSYSTDTPKFATGTVLSIDISPNFDMQLTLRLNPTGYDSWDGESCNYVCTQASGSSINKLESRTQIWRFCTPYIISLEQSPQGVIMKKILGLDNPQPIPVITEQLPVRRNLNQEQCESVLQLLNPEPNIIVQLAPPGTGKSLSIAVAIENLLLRPDAIITILTKTNISLYRLVELTHSILHNKNALVILSATAKEQHLDRFRNYREHLLANKINELDYDSLNASERRTIEQYLLCWQNRPRHADERKVIKIAYERGIKPKVILATTSMIEDMPYLLTRCTHLFADEAGQIATNELIALLTHCSSIRKLLLTGDEEQLQTYTEDLPEPVRQIGFNSVLTYAAQLNTTIITQLRTSYRGHPFLTYCLSQSCYGDNIITGVSHAQKAGFCNSRVKLPNQNIPILLINQIDNDHVAQFSYSRYNNAHSNYAILILRYLENVLPNNMPITCLCLYEEEATRLKQEYWRRVNVLVADSFQANESSIIYLLTTRSVNDNDLNSKFISNNFRTTTCFRGHKKV